MPSNQIVLSIITVTYNTGYNIEPTIISVTSNLNREIEYILIDGGSTDNTIDIIQKHCDKINYFISEHDEGIYDAMNKGIAAAKGKYVYFINAGDILYELPIDDLKKNNADLIVYPVKLSDGTVLYPYLNGMIKVKNTLPHQGCFYSLTQEISYNLKFKIFADFYLNQLLYKKDANILIKNIPVVASHDINGISHSKSAYYEIFKVVNENFGYMYVILSRIYFKYNGIRNRIKSYSNYR